MNAQVR